MTGSTVRVSLTLTSAASVGAFEAGAVAALLVGLQELNMRCHEDASTPRVHLDAVGATSAGALVGLLGTRCLLAGIDPVHVLYQSWVRQASLRRLRRTDGHAALSLRPIERQAGQLLDPRDRHGRPIHRTTDAARQQSPVFLRVALGNLHGLAFPIPGAGTADPPLAGLSHADWIEFPLGPDDDLAAYLQPERRCPLAAVLASMSHPALFEPRLLDRRHDRRQYDAAGVVNFPASGQFWYVDGAALLTDPMGQTLAAARRSRDHQQRPARGSHTAPGPDGDGHRMHVVVNPHTGSPADTVKWTHPAHPPRWPTSLSRLVASLSPQPLYQDLQRVEATNTRLGRIDELAEAVGPHLDDAATWALRAFLDAVDPDRSTATAAGSGDETGSDGPATLLRQALRTAAGLTDREQVRTEVISPMRLLDPPQQGGDDRRQAAAGQHAVPELLAGEFLGRFGGLLHRDLRHSDFVTGWRSTRRWLVGALPRHGFAPDAVAQVLAAVDARRVGYGHDGHRGGARFADLPLRSRLSVVRTALGIAAGVVRRSVGGSPY